MYGQLSYGRAPYDAITLPAAAAGGGFFARYYYDFGARVVMGAWLIVLMGAG